MVCSMSHRKYSKSQSTNWYSGSKYRRIQNNKDKGMFSTGVFIDLKKVFDRVDHEILLDRCCTAMESEELY